MGRHVGNGCMNAGRHGEKSLSVLKAKERKKRNRKAKEVLNITEALALGITVHELIQQKTQERLTIIRNNHEEQASQLRRIERQREREAARFGWGRWW